MSELRPALVVFGLLTGVVYPLIVTGVGEAAFPISERQPDRIGGAERRLPSISPAAAAYQVARVARARSVSEDVIRNLLGAATDGRTFGIFGEPRVNVVELNLALDAQHAK